VCRRGLPGRPGVAACRRSGGTRWRSSGRLHLAVEYQTVDQHAIKAFIQQLRAAGIQPDDVITDDSRLYPSVLAEIWPMPAHQLCLFHATRRVARAVSDVVKQIRRSIPTPPPASSLSLLGRFPDTPPSADQHDADSERYRWRLARRTAGIAQAHVLHQHISSARAIARQLGVNHGTVRDWLKLALPDPAVGAELAREGRVDADSGATAVTLARLGRGPPCARRLTAPSHTLPAPA